MDGDIGGVADQRDDKQQIAGDTIPLIWAGDILRCVQKGRLKATQETESLVQWQELLCFTQGRPLHLSASHGNGHGRRGWVRWPGHVSHAVAQKSVYRYGI
jgi:hypothetical protein